MCACVHMFVGWWTCVSVDVECVCVCFQVCSVRECCVMACRSLFYQC